MTQKRMKASLTTLILAGLVCCLSLCSNHAGANLPAEPSQPVKLKEICRLEEKDGDLPERFLSVAFAPGECHQVYTTSYAPKSRQVFLRSWDIAKRQLLWQRAVATIEQDRDVPLGAFRLTIEPDGRWIAFNDYEKVQVWKVRDFVFEDKGLGIKRHEFQAGKKYGDLPVAVEGTNRWVAAVRVSPDGQRLAAVYSGQRITWWDVVCRTSYPPQLGFAQHYRPNEKMEINAWDETCNQLLCLAFDRCHYDPVAQRLDIRIAVAGNYARIAFWDLETRKKTGHWQIYDDEKPDRDPDKVYDLDWMRVKGQRYWVSAHASGDDALFSYGRGVRMVLGKGEEQSEGFVLVWDESGKKIARCQHAGAVLAVAVSANDSWFVSGEFCKAWKVLPPEVAAGLPIPRRGTWVDYLDLPSRIYIWDISGRRLAVGEGHAMGITDVAVSSDGKRIASCSADGTLRIWEVPATIHSRN